jgi:probable DNA metabolism protein
MAAPAEMEATIAHDGSFPGFLCACAEALNAPDPAPRVLGSSAPEGLFEQRIAVRRDDDRAAALWDRIGIRAGAEALKTVLEAFVSDIPGADASAALALRRLWREGAAALLDLSDPEMLAVEKAAGRSRHEAHMHCGVTRFSELSDGSFYAPVKPDCDVLVLISDHFAARFGPMRFAIHDIRRGTAVLHEPGRSCELVEGFRLGEGRGPACEIPLSERELEVKMLWRLYFETIAIEERKNPLLQRSHLPKKYWSRLTEMSYIVNRTLQ